ncbi:hypothetical protein [Labilibacter marinus]|uniref:hypothetical protein n=1 Tax=Labilibacter marinus TaxID=1477105 RepID=UPI00082D048B|nr:hypothetical protein [Labilibacter marinus]
MLEVVRYTKEKKQEWDEFVSQSKNGLFLFKRDFMEYHSDRFEDYSLMVYKQSKLVAILPANIVDNQIFSHQGLTFGGIIIKYKTTSNEYLKIGNFLNSYLVSKGVKAVTIKCIPEIYKTHFGGEEEYFLFKMNANKTSSYLSSVLDLTKPFFKSKGRKSCLSKAIKNNVEVSFSDDLTSFWNILEDNLSIKYDCKPVHSLSEIKTLKNRFPDNIKLILAKKDETVIAGILLFYFNNILKIQYVSSTDNGNQIGGVDAIYNSIINSKNIIDKIDMGHSNESDGLTLNHNLLKQKNSFGARGVINNVYKYSLVM